MPYQTFRKKIIAITLLNLIFNFSTFAQGTSWAQNIKAEDPQWPGYYNTNITKGARLSDGYVICGTTYNGHFPSQNGDTVSISGGGPFVAKYDFNGNLIWLDYGIDQFYSNFSIWPTISSVTTDGNDNIYICGSFREDQLFYYNNGQDSIHISQIDPDSATPFPGNFVAKLNPQGIPVWHAGLYGVEPNHISNVTNTGIVVSGEIEQFHCGYVIGMDTTQTFNFTTFPSNPQFLYWIDNNGQFVHSTIITQSSTNYRHFEDLATDNEGNTYILGQFEKSIRFSSTGNNNVDSIAIPQGFNYGKKFFIAKYDSSGNFLWQCHDRYNPLGNTVNGTAPSSISITESGTIYVATKGSTAIADSVIHFHNSDNTIIDIPTAEKLIYKITKNGHFVWDAHFYDNTYYGALFASDSVIVYSGQRNYSQSYPAKYTDTVYSVNGPDYRVVHSHAPNIHFLQFDTSGSILNSGVIGDAQRAFSYQGASLLKGPSSNSYILSGDVNGVGDSTAIIYHDTLHFSGYEGYSLRFNFNESDTVGTIYNDPIVKITNISTDTLCKNGQFIVYDSIWGDFFPTNFFRVQLSNANGYFPSPATTIGMSTMPTDSIVCTIPANTPLGSGYRIRFTSTNLPRYSDAIPVNIFNSTENNVSIITSPGNTANSGETVTFTAQSQTSGDNPTYEWFINNQQVPGETNAIFFTNSLTDGDIITVKMKSSILCALPEIAAKSVTIHITTGINDLNIAGGFKIYPNPNSNGILTIHFDSMNTTNFFNVTISDMMGKEVYKRILENTAQADHQIILPSEISTGVYFIKLSSKESSKTMKIVLNRS